MTVLRDVTVRETATESMARSSVALASSALALTVGGFGFWYLLSLQLTNDQLGNVAALTSLVLFLSGVTRLNLQDSLPALLPGAGQKGRRLVSYSYLAAVLLGLAVSVAFVAVSDVFGSGVVGLEGSLVWLIPPAVVIWSVFSIQDGALVGAGQSNAVAKKNMTYSTVRLIGAALIVFGVVSPTTTGALAAWFLPLIAFVPAINLIVYRSLSGPSRPGFATDANAKFVASDFMGSFGQLALTRGTSYAAVLLFAGSPGAELSVVWLFFLTIDIVFQQMGSAVATAIRNAPGEAETLIGRAMQGAAVVAVLAGVSGIVLSPYLLGLLLDDPSAAAVTSLRLVFVGIASRPLYIVWLAHARSHQLNSWMTFGPVSAFAAFVIAVVPGVLMQSIVVFSAGFALSQILIACLILLSNFSSRTSNSEASSFASSIRFRVSDPLGLGNTHSRSTNVEFDDASVDSTWTQKALRGLSAFGLVASGLLLWLSALGVDYDAVGGYGLIQALPAVYWVCIAAITLTFIGFLLQRSGMGAATSVALLLVATHGIEPLTAPRARFSIAWLIVGFSDLVAETGSADRFFDARFVWPGFFTSAAAGLPADQDAPVDILLRVWPVALVAVWTGLVWAMARYFFPRLWFAAPISAWIFILIAWSGQNYFSPQGLNATLVVLVILFVSVIGLDLDDGSIRDRLRWVVYPRLARDASKPVAAVVLMMSAGIIVSHPLSPVFLIAWLGALAAAGNRVARGLPLVVSVMFLTWVSNVGRPWWSTRIEEIVGDIGAVGDTVSRSTTERSAAASEARSHVLLGRLGLVLAVAALTIAAALYLRRRFDVSTYTLLGLAGVPSLLVAGQPYGGEIIVRIFLFAIFPCAVLIGAAIAATSKRKLAALVIVSSAIGAPLFMIAHFGNETFEMTRESDFQAISAAYAEAPEDTLFITQEGFISWGFTRLENTPGGRNHTFLSLTDSDDLIESVATRAHEDDFEFAAVVTAESLEQWGIETLSRSDTWLEEVADSLDSATQDQGVTTMYREGTSGAFLVDVDVALGLEEADSPSKVVETGSPESSTDPYLVISWIAVSLLLISLLFAPRRFSLISAALVASSMVAIVLRFSEGF